MSKEIYIPQLGQTVEQVTLVRWLVEDSTPIEEGQGVLEVETDKAVFTVEATARGHLHLGPFKTGDVVPVLTVVATIGQPDEIFAVNEPSSMPEPTPESVGMTPRAIDPGSPDPLKAFASPRARKLATAKSVELGEVTPTGYGGARIAERDVIAYLSPVPKATPVAQKMAAGTGVDLRQVTGTGPGGIITKDDVARPQKSKASPTPLPEVHIRERILLKGVRAIIADRMAKSAHTTASVTLFMEVDATELVNLRERLKARVAEAWGFAPGFNDLLAKITATALHQFPTLNARITPDSIEQLAGIHLGMAVDTDRGLLVPVIRNADQKSLSEFGIEFRALAERARTGKSLPDDLSGGTFTITNLGMFDVLAFTPIINLPETAILGVGCITPQPVVREGQIVVRQMMMLSLAFDHRIVDGAPAARFLQQIKSLIEEPYLMLKM